LEPPANYALNLSSPGISVAELPQDYFSASAAQLGFQSNVFPPF